MYSFLNNKKTTNAITDGIIYSRNLKNPQEFQPVPYSQESLETRLKKSTLYRVSRPSNNPQSAVAQGEVFENIEEN